MSCNRSYELLAITLNRKLRTCVHTARKHGRSVCHARNLCHEKGSPIPEDLRADTLPESAGPSGRDPSDGQTLGAGWHVRDFCRPSQARLKASSFDDNGNQTTTLTNFVFSNYVTVNGSVL